MVANAQGDLVHVHGRTGDYFELAQGQTRTGILDMAHEGLPHELAVILRFASANDDEVTRENVRGKPNGAYTIVHLSAKMVEFPASVFGLVFIAFRPSERNLDSAGDQIDSPVNAHAPVTDDQIIDGQINENEMLARGLTTFERRKC